MGSDGLIRVVSRRWKGVGGDCAGHLDAAANNLVTNHLQEHSAWRENFVRKGRLGAAPVPLMENEESRLGSSNYWEFC